MILADTSVWIEHFRHGLDRLAAALDHEQVLMHPFIIGELACGTLRNRVELLDLLARLPQSPVATHNETLAFIEQHRLTGRGLGYVDANLLAATALSATARLWSRDRRLALAAARLDLRYQG